MSSPAAGAPTPPPVDDEMVRQLGAAARSPVNQAVAPPSAPWRLPRVPWGAILDALAWLGAVGAAAGIAGVFGWKAAIRLRPWWGDEATVARAAWADVAVRLAELGWAREEGETRAALARRMAERAPALAALERWATRAALVGGPGAGVGEVRAAWRAVVAELKAAAPWWRRALGWLDLRSPFRAR
jgi:hypothetical protein